MIMEHAPQDLYPLGLRVASGRNKILRQSVESGKIVVAPGAFDCLTARLVEKAGFPALYVTGSGVSISALGAPDVGLMSFGEILDRVKRIADSTAIPVIADADTGYGGPLNVIRTVRELERAGVSGIQIEDQTWPKKCGHEAGRQLATADEMIGRIKAAVDARMDENLLIIARTDARSEYGLAAAIDRAEQYAEAGADVLFVESPENEEELRQVAATLGRPVLANMVEGGRTPITPASILEELGYRIAIYPNALTRTIARAGADMLATLRQDGTTAAYKDKMLDHKELWSLFDYASWTGTEARFAMPPATTDR
jgi:2-methylisocitrate lyase-like PEP mutase family enzyme